MLKSFRKSLRLSFYDYASEGAYFVTFCAYKRLNIFGEIADGFMYPNETGRMLSAVWEQIPHFYNGVKIDEYIVMPNHFHGIIFLNRQSKEQGWDPASTGLLSLCDVVGRFKSLTTYKYAEANHGQKRLWQRNYYDRVIRHEIELNRLRKYVIDNPRNWEKDETHG